jgi:hypothetical protein
MKLNDKLTDLPETKKTDIKLQKDLSDPKAFLKDAEEHEDE